MLANPPISSGLRTINRVALARSALCFDEVAIANLFALPTHSTNDISTLGVDPTGWLAARETLEVAINDASAVLLAYGTSEPLGLARYHHRNQVEWLWETLLKRTISVYQVGDGPRHPSRWHRWTHQHHPDSPFAEVIGECFTEVSPVGCRQRPAETAPPIAR